MYDELIKELCELSHEFYLDDNNKYAEEKLKEAADAIEELSAYVALYKDGGETAMKVAQEYKAAYIAEHDAIELLQKTQQPRWIPVSERLPEEKTNVLILADTIAGKMAKVSFLYKDDEGKNCWTGLDVYGLNPCDWQPTHWMPLPTPPKGEKE